MGLFNPYLGKPGAMRVIPAPRDTVDSTASRGDVPHTLLSGGTVTTRRLYERRAYELPYPELEHADALTLLNFYRGVYGVGPWCYIDPAVVNVLPLDYSTCGVRSGSIIAWSGTSGPAPTFDASTASPVDGSGALKWLPGASGVSLYPGSGGAAATVNPRLWLPPVVGLPVTLSFYCKLSAAGNIQAGLSNHAAADGSFAGNVATLTTFSASTSWQRFTLTVTPSSTSQAVMAPKFTSSSSSTVWLAGLQAEYAATSPSDWVPGELVARCVFTEPPGRAIAQLTYSSHTLKLAEV